MINDYGVKMTIWHSDLHKRKKSGGKKGIQRKKRRYERGSDPVLVMLGEREIKPKRTRGGGIKIAVKSDRFANVYDPASNKTSHVEIIRVKSNPANRDLERRGIITKGAIIETPIGDARVTSKPSSDGVINAVLLPKQ
jgi:small subunit ribosomal protein S8e